MRLPGGWQVIFQKNLANEIHHIWQPLKGGLCPRWSVPIPPLIILESLFSFFLASPQCDCDRGASTSHWTAAETEGLSLTIAVIRINPQSGNTIRGPQQRYAVVAERSEELRHKKNRYERDVRAKIHLLWAKATFKNIFTDHFFFYYSTTWRESVGDFHINGFLFLSPDLYLFILWPRDEVGFIYL